MAKLDSEAQSLEICAFKEIFIPSLYVSIG